MTRGGYMEMKEKTTSQGDRFSSQMSQRAGIWGGD